MIKYFWKLFILFGLMLYLAIPTSAQVQLDSVINEDAFYVADSLDLSPDSLMVDSLCCLHDSIHSHPLELVDYLLPKDSLDTYWFSLMADSINYTRLNYIDTLNHSSGQYNPTRKMDKAYIDLGLIGSAQKNQLFSTSPFKGFQVGIHAFDAYLWNPTDIRLFDTRTPYTRILYVMGAKKENVLDLAHAQSFLDDQLAASFKFQLFNHLGSYNHQHTDVKSFQIGMRYRTKNKRYAANVQYYHNKQILLENGGIRNLSDFEENKETNRQVIKTNLEEAENLVRVSGAVFKQHFYLSKPEPDFSKIPDTNRIEMEGYSVTHFKKPYFDPVSHLGRISHYFNYERQNFRYTDADQDSPIYNGIPYYSTPDSSVFFDTIGMRKYVNEFIYSNSDFKDDINNPKFLNYFAGFRHEYAEYSQDSAVHFFNHSAIIGGAFVSLTKYLSLLSDVEYYVGDYLNNDFKWNAKVFFRLKKNLITGGFQLISQEPDWIFQDYSTSRFTWQNNFEKVNIQVLSGKFERKNLKAYMQLRNISQYVYFNEAILPEQTNQNIQHVWVQLEKTILLKHWGTDFVLNYQNVSHPDIIRVPEVTGRIKLYYHNFFFENALDLEIGVELSYFTKYKADKYMPAIRSFHIQNEQEIGEFLIADVYANIKLGSARLFVRYDHFNASLMEYNYYASPDYPMQDAAFKFGVNWILFN